MGTLDRYPHYTQGKGIDEPLAELISGTTSYYEQDGLGSVTSLSNSGGALTEIYVYDSYSKVTASTGTLSNRFQYTGRELDPESGTYYYRARYFDQNLGRFASEDQIRFVGGANFYRYADDNPVLENDPSGWLPKNKDRWWGYDNDDFHKWWHRCYWTNMPFDGDKEDVETGYAIWESLGKPQNGDCGGKKPCPGKEPAPDTEPTTGPETEPTPAPDPTKTLTWGLAVGTGLAIAEEYGWIVLAF